MKKRVGTLAARGLNRVILELARMRGKIEPHVEHPVPWAWMPYSEDHTFPSGTARLRSIRPARLMREQVGMMAVLESYITTTRPGNRHGAHTHVRKMEIMVVASGTFGLALHDPQGREQTYATWMDADRGALLVYPGTWHYLIPLTPDAMLVVYSSHLHDEDPDTISEPLPPEFKRWTEMSGHDWAIMNRP